MSNFNTEVSPLQIEFIPHVNFVKLFENSLFNTSPDYYNAQSEGTLVEYSIGYSTQPDVLIGSITEYINGTFSESINSYVCSADDIYSSNNIEITIPNNEPVYNNTTVELIKFNTDIAPISMRKSEAQAYTKGLSIVTRYDSSSDLSTILFVSDGSNTTMPNTIFREEIERTVKPDFYDDSNTNPQLSGWAVAVCNTTKQALTTNISTTTDQTLSTFNQDQAFLSTSTDYIKYLKDLPKVYYEPGNVYTFDNEANSTTSGFLLIDFDDLIPPIPSAIIDEAVIIFTVTEDLKPKDLIAVADTVGYRNTNNRFFYSVYPKMVMCWTDADLIII